MSQALPRAGSSRQRVKGIVSVTLRPPSTSGGDPMSKTAGQLPVIALFVILMSLTWLSQSRAAPIPTATAMPMQLSTTAPAPMTTEQRDRALALTPDSGLASPVTGTDWSIFNHRGAGFFVLLWGLTAFIAGLQWPRKTWFNYVPPMALFGLAEFLIL